MSFQSVRVARRRLARTVASKGTAPCPCCQLLVKATGVQAASTKSASTPSFAARVRAARTTPVSPLSVAARVRAVRALAPKLAIERNVRP